MSTRQERKEAKLAAFGTIKELVDTQEDKKYEEALKVLRPSLYATEKESMPGVPRVSIAQKVVDKIVELGSCSEDVIFQEFKIGRKETAGLIRKVLKKADASTRVWINFDAEAGTYKVLGTGEIPPAEYTGYVPVDEEIDLNTEDEPKKKKGFFG